MLINHNLNNSISYLPSCGVKFAKPGKVCAVLLVI
jgi:hypothetical protein